MIRVLDISVYQGAAIQWALVAQIPDVRGVILQAQQGNDGPNPDFAAQLAGARASGLAVGVYHFADILPDSPAHTNRDPVGQIGLLVATLAAAGYVWQPGDLPPMLDCESPETSRWSVDGVSPEFAAGWIATALEEMDARLGRPAGIYCGAPWWRALAAPGRAPGFGARPLWLAAYPGPWDAVPPPDGTPWPAAPPPWDKATLWQHGDKVPLPGGGPCDGSVFAGDDDAWQAFVGL
jgi:GH25 family lysozyme M1 (1,4-beta-N-acetylmuramidase)